MEAKIWKLVETLKKDADTAGTLKEEATNSKKGLSTLHGTHNKMLTALKDVGYSEGDVSEFVTGLKVKLEKATELEGTAEKGKTENQKLLDRIQNLEKKSTTATEEAKREKTLRRQGVIREVLTGKLKDKIYGLNAHVTAMINEKLVDLGDDEKTVHFVKDGQQIDMDTGITEYLDAHKDDQKNDQSGGSGGGNQGTGESGDKVKGQKNTRA